MGIGLNTQRSHRHLNPMTLKYNRDIIQCAKEKHNKACKLLYRHKVLDYHKSF